jgi:hypothetical protein
LSEGRLGEMVLEVEVVHSSCGVTVGSVDFMGV